MLNRCGAARGGHRFGERLEVGDREARIDGVNGVAHRRAESLDGTLSTHDNEHRPQLEDRELALHRRNDRLLDLSGRHVDLRCPGGIERILLDVADHPDDSQPR